MNSFSPGDRPLDHVAIAVSSIADTAHIFELVSGQVSSPPEEIGTQGVRVAFCGQVEFLEPLGPETAVGRFLQRRGQALHHIAYRSDDLQTELERLSGQGIELIDASPRPGARGHLVAFLHPRSTGGVLVELVQRP